MGPNNQGYAYPSPQIPYATPYAFSQQNSQRPSFSAFAQQQNQQNNMINPDLIPCKFVDNPEKIMPADVPSTGDPAFFVTRDFQTIFGKAVNSSGLIDTLVYKIAHKESPDELQKVRDAKIDESMAAFGSKIESLEKTVSNLVALFETEEKK